MSIPLNINGSVFEYPVNFDADWGIDATGWAQAVTNGMLQRQGGNFPLLADANFGPNFGLISLYYKSSSSNISASGQIRLATGDSIGWRDDANTADILLAKDSSDNLLWNGHIISSGGSGTVLSITGTANQVTASSPTGNVTLSLPQSIATASSPTFTGLTLLNESALNLQDSGSVHTISLQAPSTTANYSLVFPPNAGSSGQVLRTDGAGTTTWVNAAGGGTVNSGTAGQLAYYASSGSTLSGLADLSYSSPVLTLAPTGVQTKLQITSTGGSNSAVLEITANSNPIFFSVGSTGNFLIQDSTRNIFNYTPSAGGLIQLVVPLSMQSNLIENVTDPVSTQDAATKNYVDTHVVGTTTLATPTIVGCTAGSNQCQYTLLSPKLLYVYGSFQANSATATTALMGIPTGTVATGTATPGLAGVVILGTWIKLSGSTSTSGVIWCDGSAANLKFSLLTGLSGSSWSAQNGSTVWTSGDWVTYSYTCPLA